MAIDKGRQWRDENNGDYHNNILCQISPQKLAFSMNCLQPSTVQPESKYLGFIKQKAVDFDVSFYFYALMHMICSNLVSAPKNLNFASSSIQLINTVA